MSRQTGVSWLFRLGIVVAIGAAVHLLVVWAVPRLIMQRVLSMPLPLTEYGVHLPPMTDHTQRRIVMPSPDLLYATCAFDLTERPLRIRAEPKTANYWSIALYAANSDNFFVLNDRQAAGAPVDLILLGPRAYAPAPALPPGARSVMAPSVRGLLLMRVLVGDPVAGLPVAQTARSTLRCEAL